VTGLDDGLTATAFELDELGRMVARIHPDGTRTRWEYDRCDRPTTIHDPTGAITRIEYTAGGRVRREVAPSGRVDEREYDRCGRLCARIDGAGRRWEHRYDADGALTERIEPSGAVARFTYDLAGRLRESSDPGSGVARYDYDEAGRTVAITDRVAGTRRFDYDAAGRLVAATDANGATTRYAYDERDRVVEIAPPLGGSTVRSYDAIGRLVAETDPLGRVTTLAYDAAGRLVELVDGRGRATLWSYDAAGRVRSFGAAGREPITIERDALGREIAIREPGAPANRLCWDEAGRLVERSRGELTMRWRYTADGERAALGYPDGTETTYSYDQAGFLAGTDHPAVGAIAYERDAAGRLVGATGAGMRARWRYEEGDLAEYELVAGGRRRTAQLTRDPLGRVVAATMDGEARRYSYDLAGQLLSAETPDGLFSFSYDANGRLVCETSRIGTTEYEYDAAGQLRARRGAAVTAWEYDGAGRRVGETSGDFSRTWRWDDLGRLVRIESSDAPAGDVRATDVTVDALGELAEVGGTPLLWDTADVLSPLTWMDTSAVIGNGSPWALASAGAARWLAPDWQGTVGDAPRDPLGAVSGGPDLGGGPRLGYRGELEFEGETWLRSRAYEPASRSFLQPDPLPGVPGTAWSANPYHYAGNNPIGLCDPLGLRPITDAELQHYRDRMSHNLLGRVLDAAGGASVSVNWVGQELSSLRDAAYRGIEDEWHDVSTWAHTPINLPNSRWFTGIGNLAYGAYKVGTGVDMLIAGTAADVTGIGAVVGVPVQGVGAYQVVTGGFRMLRGGKQLVDATEHPTVKQSPLQYGKRTFFDVVPFGGGIENLLGGLP
jgi:RHS repeat-associated protein